MTDAAWGSVCRVTEGLIDDEQGGLRAGVGCVDQVFTLKQIGEKAMKKMVGCFVEVYRIRGLKVNAGKSKVMVLDGGGVRK